MLEPESLDHPLGMMHVYKGRKRKKTLHAVLLDDTDIQYGGDHLEVPHTRGVAAFSLSGGAELSNLGEKVFHFAAEDAKEATAWWVT